MSQKGSTSELRKKFLEAIDPEEHFYRIFDQLPNILFFAKDREGRLLAVNKALLQRYGFMNEAEILGKTDFDLLPRSLAEKFREDDVNIAETGKPMLDIVELFINRQGIPDWFLTNKRPIFAKDGSVIGVMGTIENYESYQEITPPDLDISEALKLIRRQFNRDLSVQQLADLCGMSVRQFERKFKKHLRTTPQQFIMKMRVHAACDALRMGNRPIAEVAVDLGFYDQSSFTRHFRKHMGITPLHYRKTFR